MKRSSQRYILPGSLVLVTAAVFMFALQPARAADEEVVFTEVTDGDIWNDAANSYAPAWGDYDHDGWVDLFVPNGGNEGPATQFLYRNNAHGGFVRADTADVGGFATDQVQSAQGNWADYDNDGDLDLFMGSIQRGEPYRLYANEGNGQFRRVTADVGLLQPLLPVGPWKCAWGDYDNDGFADLYLARGYVADGVIDRLMRNRGDGTFHQAEGIDFSLMDVNQGAWGDADNDGDLDLLICALGAGSNPFYRNLGNGAFAIESSSFGGDGAASVIWADFNNDGYLDAFVARIKTPCDHFQNNRDGTFKRIDTGPQLQVAGQCSSAGDYDNDGDVDLFLTWGQSGGGSCSLFRNDGNGAFVSVTTSMLTQASAHFTDCAWADYDNNGALDIFVTTVANEYNYLYHNEGNANAWMIVSLKGTVSNRSAIGAKVRVLAHIGENQRWQMRQISGGVADDLRAHFGLGDATQVDTLRIEWPSGIVQELKDVAPNQILTVTEPPRLIPQDAGGFRIQSWINQSFDVQCSTNLTQWDTIDTVTNQTGTLVFHDPEVDQHDCRYYRVAAE